MSQVSHPGQEVPSFDVGALYETSRRDSSIALHNVGYGGGGVEED